MSSVFRNAPFKASPPPSSNDNWEKNWIPFAIDATHVGLIYSHEPWDVITLKVEPGQRPQLMEVHRTQGLTWEDGTIRGGSPPVRYDDSHLITFFHSTQVIGSRRLYSVGACVFSANPPYEPELQTAHPLLTSPYKSGAERFGWRFAGSVIFPMGAERTRDGYLLLCGIDDGEIGSFFIPAADLEQRLEPPRSAVTGSVHDYRGRGGIRFPLKRLLYVPDPIPGIPELAMINFIRTLAGRGRTFVDIGSHIGFYTMGLAPGFERVVAFEPSKFQYGWLTRNRALNAYEHVLCEHVALGDTRGDATLNVLSYEGGLNSLSPEVANAHHIIDRYSVPVELLDDRGMTDVDLMKIDVEGFEIPVLRGARKTIEASRPVILIEVWTDVARRQNTFEPLFPLSPELVLCLPQERREILRLVHLARLSGGVSDSLPEAKVSVLTVAALDIGHDLIRRQHPARLLQKCPVRKLIHDQAERIQGKFRLVDPPKLEYGREDGSPDLGIGGGRDGFVMSLRVRFIEDR